jgi:alkanesulfonate monooxygenase SsuD/methylene tetrahydromethanopterin reductase-like flavin-dependent oxidoreductase (luciferase family)
MPGLRFGLYYDFRNPPQWRRDPTALYNSILAQIARAEALGWDDVWLSEHHFVEDGYTPSCLPLAAAIAARTSRMRVGTAVMLLPLHDPVRLAEDAATVDVLSGGRLDLGVGTGYRAGEFEGFGIPLKTRVGRLVEGLQILRALFAGETLTHRGKYYQCDNVSLYPRPVQRPLKVWLGGFIEAAGRRAARYADALVVSGFATEPIRAYRDELMKLGKNPADHEVASGAMWLVVARDPERREREAREHFLYQLDLYARWSAELSGWEEYTRRLAADTDLPGRGVLVVSPAQATDIIRKYVEEMRVNRWYSWTLPPGLPPEWADEHIELMAKEVIPAFR